jgi:hypothetical protein
MYDLSCQDTSVAISFVAWKVLNSVELLEKNLMF